jgi:tetratricopeptide (TPR) repeat protein
MRLTLAILLLLLLAAPARAFDPSTPRIGPEESPRAKVSRLLGSFGPAGEASRKRLGDGQLDIRLAVHELLTERYADYAAAVRAFDKDGANVEDFQKILATATDPALRAHATFYLGRTYLDTDEFEKACECFDRVRGELANQTPWTDEATLYLGYAYARRPELEEDKEKLFRARARICLEMLSPTDGARPVYGACPERARESACWLLKELSGEGSGPLLELARRMETIEHSIDHEKTGRPTQKRQEAVISEIDRLIALMREKEQNGQGKGGGGQGKGKNGNQAGRPRQKSVLPGELTPGQIRNTRSGGGSEWGESLPDKDREAALQLLKEKFPERYKELVEQYFKTLAEQQGNKDK